MYDRVKQLALTHIDQCKLLGVAGYRDWFFGRDGVEPCEVDAHAIDGTYLMEWLHGEADDLNLDGRLCDAYPLLPLVPGALRGWINCGKLVYEIPYDQFRDLRVDDPIRLGDIVWPATTFLLLLSDTPKGGYDALLVNILEGGRRYTLTGLTANADHYKSIAAGTMNQLYGADRADAGAIFDDRWNAIKDAKMTTFGRLDDEEGVPAYVVQIVRFVYLLALGSEVVSAYVTAAGDDATGSCDGQGESDHHAGARPVPAEGLLDILKHRVLEFDYVEGRLHRCRRDSTGRVRAHWRRGHYRRAPGSPPGSPKTIPVKGTWVNRHDGETPIVPAVAAKVDFT
jgi:hypothetical protein